VDEFRQQRRQVLFLNHRAYFADRHSVGPKWGLTFRRALVCMQSAKRIYDGAETGELYTMYQSLVPGIV